MQLTEKTGKASKGQTKVTSNKWKEKAIARRKEIERLKKRIKELIASRDNCKAKCKAQRVESKTEQLVSGQKAARHQYSIELVMMILEFLS